MVFTFLFFTKGHHSYTFLYFLGAVVAFFNKLHRRIPFFGYLSSAVHCKFLILVNNFKSFKNLETRTKNWLADSPAESITPNHIQVPHVP